MQFIPIKTRIIQPPQDAIWNVIDGLSIQDGDIVFITSKILAIHQGRTRVVGSVSKQELMKQEASHHRVYQHPDDFEVNLTITDGTLILAAGIDESNADGHYVLWPTGVDSFCQTIRQRIIDRTGVKRLGVVATDSHSIPLRLGVVGMAIGLAGVEPLKDIRGAEDIFGREIHLTRINMVDPLAAMAVQLMGEAAETTPVLILRDYDGIVYDAHASSATYRVLPENDVYKPLLDVIPPVEP